MTEREASMDCEINSEPMNTEIDKLFERAITYFNMPSPEEAYKMFRKIIEIDPHFRADNGHRDDPYADNPYFYMGRFHDYYFAEFETATGYYSKSIELCPKDLNSYECRGMCWLKTNKSDLALKDFRKALELKEQYGHAEMLPDLDDITTEVENRLGGGKPNREYDGLFSSGV